MRIPLHRPLVTAVLAFGGLLGVLPSPVQAAPIAGVETVQYYGPGPGYYRGPPRGYYRPLYRPPYRPPYYGRPFYGPRPGFYGPPRGYVGRPYEGRRFHR